MLKKIKAGNQPSSMVQIPCTEFCKHPVDIMLGVITSSSVAMASSSRTRARVRGPEVSRPRTRLSGTQRPEKARTACPATRLDSGVGAITRSRFTHCRRYSRLLQLLATKQTCKQCVISIVLT